MTYELGDKLRVLATPGDGALARVGDIVRVVHSITDIVEHCWITRTEVMQPYIYYAETNGWKFEKVRADDMLDATVHAFEVLDMLDKVPPRPEATVKPRNKYMREIAPDVWVDVYDVLYAFAVTDPCLQHLIKKALATGVRGHKSTREDLIDIRDSAIRAVEHYDAMHPVVDKNPDL